MIRILIVEDDKVLNDGIVMSLKQPDYEFIQCLTIKEARNYITNNNIDLIILDINLPDGSGYDFCKEIIHKIAAPIVFLTANDTELDEVVGLELGAVDYITKPFSLMVLRARIAAALRKYGNDHMKIIIEPFAFDFETMEFFKGTESIEFSKTEQKLLKILLDHRGKVVERNTLLDRLWTDGAEYVDENALSVTIKRLRDKLGDSSTKNSYIQTIYGIGYSWVIKNG